MGKFLVGFLSNCLLIAITFADPPNSWRVRKSGTSQQLTGIAFGNDTFLAVGPNRTVVKSTNGMDWARVPLSNGAGDPPASMRWITYANNRFVCVGGDPDLIATSQDGTVWNVRLQMSGDRYLFGIAYGASGFVAVGYAGTAQAGIWYSTNGVAWEGGAFSDPHILRAVTFANGRYVVVGDGGVIFTSTDMKTWRRRSSGLTTNLRTVIYSGGHFLAAGDTVAVQSTDGVTWADAAPPSFSVNGLAYSDDGVLAIGRDETQGRLHFSPDGVTWPGDSFILTNMLNAGIGVGSSFFVVGDNGTILVSERLVRLSDPVFSPTLGFAAYVELTSGRDFTVEASSNGRDWAPIDSLPAGGLTRYYIDSTATNFPMRLYRLR